MAKSLRSIPAILKHVTMAILRKKGSLGGSNFDRAFRIARSRLETYGYLRAGSATGPLSKIALAAGKAPAREAAHRREGAEGNRKAQMFDRWLKAELPGMLQELEADAGGKGREDDGARGRRGAGGRARGSRGPIDRAGRRR